MFNANPDDVLSCISYYKISIFMHMTTPQLFFGSNVVHNKTYRLQVNTCQPQLSYKSMNIISVFSSSLGDNKKKT